MKTRLISLLLTASVLAASWGGALFGGLRSWADGG
jgi:hypothetical protein